MWDTKIITYYDTLQPTSTTAHFVDIDLMVALSLFAAPLTYQLF